MNFEKFYDSNEEAQKQMNIVKDYISGLERNKERIEGENFLRLEGKEQYDKTVKKWKKVYHAREYLSDAHELEYEKAVQAFRDGNQELYDQLTEGCLLLTKLLTKFMTKHLKKIDRLYDELRQYTKVLDEW